MRNFWDLVNKVIHKSDVLLLVIDARMLDETRNIEVEDKVKAAKKPLIYVVTKTDLAGREIYDYKAGLSPCAYISSKNHHGTKSLRQKILIEAKRADVKSDMIKVGVLGYPNVGKSSLINALKGKHSAPTSSSSGYTKSIQHVKATNRILLLDTPGVIPYNEKDTIKHSIIGSIDSARVKQPDMIVMEIMKKFPGKIESFYGVLPGEDNEETLERITAKKNILRKGGELDIERCARAILKNWQDGKIR